MFDYCFLGGKDDAETLAVQVARDGRTQMLFAHIVTRKGMVHEHGAAAMVSDIERLGCKEIILKCDGEPAMVFRRRSREDEWIRRSWKTQSPEIVAAKRLREHVRVLRAGCRRG